MQRIISAVFCVLLVVSFSNCSRKTDPEGAYQKSSVVADGELNEWSLPLRFGNKSGTIQYSITNDKENVYIALLSKDEATEEKILRMGMTVYFDPSGGDNKNISINYPMKSFGGPNADEKKERAATGTSVNEKSRKQEMMLQSSSFVITGFQHLENRAYERGDKNPIQLAVKINNDNNLVYEAVVPIKNILGRALTVNDPKKNFAVGFIIKGFQMSGAPSGGNPGIRGGGGRGGGRGMGGRGGMGGGGRTMTTPGSANRTALIKDDVNWYKFRLADK